MQKSKEREPFMTHCLTARKALPLTFLLAFFSLFAEAAQTTVNKITYIKGTFPPVAESRLGVCSFNIKWLGHYKNRDNRSLARVLRGCDLVVVQEMVAPPWTVRVDEAGMQKELKGDAESAGFVAAMAEEGFDGTWLSEEDTGPNRNHTAGPASEWNILFYRSSKVEEARDLPHGFIDYPLAKNPLHDRVPYAFAVRSKDEEGGQVDLVLISVHLHASNYQKGDLQSSMARRILQFSGISSWINDMKKNHPSSERDFYVMGDTNIENSEELAGFLGSPTGEVKSLVNKMSGGLGVTPEFSLMRTYRSLNSKVVNGKTELAATNVTLSKPFDHIFYSIEKGGIEIIPTFSIIDLAGTFVRDYQDSNDSFMMKYSDHDPIRFELKIQRDND
jgi:hypothetical protein